MNILHIIEGKANPNRANGVNQVVHGLAKYQSRAGNKVRIFGMSRTLEKLHDVVDWGDFSVDVFKQLDHSSWPYLMEMIEESDIVHLHGVWKWYNQKIGKYLVSIGKPYVITAHCGLAEDRIKQSNYFLKKIYHYLFQRNLYEKASAVHALTLEESTDLLKYCNNKIFVVNNGVDFEIFKEFHYEVKNRDKILIGYLGRFSIEKNIDSLISAISILPGYIKDKIELRLIGPVDDNTAFLKKLIKESNLENCIIFCGGKYGKEKIESLLDLDAYIHPASSDVVGISVMEALALGIPTIVTRTSHMSYFYNSGAFIMIEPTVQDISRGIIEFVTRKSEWNSISSKARSLAETVFNWERVAARILMEYEKLLK